MNADNQNVMEEYDDEITDEQLQQIREIASKQLTGKVIRKSFLFEEDNEDN